MDGDDDDEHQPAVPLPVLDLLHRCSSAPSVGSDIADHIRSRSDAVRSVLSSLDVAIAASGDDDDRRRAERAEWSDFLLGDEDADVRDGLAEALVRCCAEREDYAHSTDDPDVVGACTDLLAVSLECLASVLRVRSSAAEERSRRNAGGGNGRKVETGSLVGQHLPSLAPCIVSAFELTEDDWSASVVAASIAGSAAGGSASGPNLVVACRDVAAELTRRLLPPLCGRDECPPVSVRDGVLLPLSRSVAAASVAEAAELLSWSVVETARLASSSAHASSNPPGGGRMSPREREEHDETLRLRAEGAALGRMQEMRAVFDNVALRTLETDGEDGERIREALKAMCGVAPHAVESLLLGGAAGRNGAEILRAIGVDAAGGSAGAASGAGSLSVATGPDSGDVGSPALPPFYAKLSDPPIEMRTEKSLLAELEVLDDALREFDQELWNVRFDALKKMERIIAGGVVRTPNLRTVFLSKLRKMPITEQIEDLRSQITRQAVRVVVALAYEMRELNEHECAVAMAHLAERWTDAVLKLSISGVRLMATQGMNGMLHLYALGGGYGYPRTIPVLIEGCTGKKVHQNHRRGCILALSAALRVWNASSMERHLDGICRAVGAAASDRDPAVREEGRKAFWALHSRREFRSAADVLLGKVDMREQKRLRKVKDETDAEWAEGGRMEVLVRTGVDEGGEASPKTSSGPGAARRSAKAGSSRPGSAAESRRGGVSSSGRGRNEGLAAAKARGKAALAATGRKSLSASVMTPSHRTKKVAPSKIGMGRTSLVGGTPQSRGRSRADRTLENRPQSSIPKVGAGISSAAAPSKSPKKRSQLPRFGTVSASSSVAASRSSAQSSLPPQAQRPQTIVEPQIDVCEGPVPMEETPASSRSRTSVSQSESIDVDVLKKVPPPEKSSPCDDAALPPPPPSSIVKPVQTNALEDGDVDEEDEEELFADLLSPRSSPTLGFDDASMDTGKGLVGNSEMPPRSTPVRMGAMPEPKMVTKSTVKFAPETVLPPTPPPTPPRNAVSDSTTKAMPSLQQQSHAETPSSLRKIEEVSTPVADVHPEHVPGTDPVLRYMARPSPLSSEKLLSFREGDGGVGGNGGGDGDILPRIIAKLSRASLPQEQHLGIKALTQYARQSGDDPQWERHFAEVLECLLDGFSDIRSTNVEGNTKEVLSPVPVNTQHLKDEKPAVEKSGIVSSPATLTATRHLYIQGARALLKYIPSYFEGHIEVTMTKLLQCANCSTYEVVHTAERALENLVASLDSRKCLRSLLPFLDVADENGDDWAVPLLGLRTLCKLIERASAQDLLDVLATMGPSLVTAMRHKAVDMRKASVFAVVEMHFVVGKSLMLRLDGLSAANIRLISIYIERHPKSSKGTVMNGEAPVATGSKSGVTA